MSDIIYNEEDHSYTLDGKKLQSVTEIVSNICGINKKYFKAGAAAEGTDIHTELARYYDPTDSFSAEDFTIDRAAQMALYLKYSATFRTEVIVYNKEHEYAGTADLISITGNKIHDIVDFKSGTVNKKYCTAQLSLYKLALESMGYDCSETRLRVISPKGITNIVPLDWECVMDLEKSELDTPHRDTIERIEKDMERLRPYVEEYKELEEGLRRILLQEMGLSGATNYFGAVFDATYVAPSIRTGLDTARLRAEQPEIYSKYLKETNVSATVKLTMKSDENE